MLEEGEFRAAGSQPAPDPSAPGRGVPLLRLTSRTCRWPLWGDHVRPTPDVAFYCGADVADGGSYCACHAPARGHRAAPLSASVLKVAQAGTVPAPRGTDEDIWGGDEVPETPRVRSPAPPLPVAPRRTEPQEDPSVFVPRYAEIAARLQSTHHRPQSIVRRTPTEPMPGEPPALVTAVPVVPEPAPEPDPVHMLDLPPARRGGKPLSKARTAAERAAQIQPPEEQRGRQTLAEDLATRAVERTASALPCLGAEDGEVPDIPPPPPVIRVSAIMDVVCDGYGVSRTDLTSHRRGRTLVEARQVAMWLAKMYTAHSLPSIGKIMSRDHTTVLFGVYKIDTQRKLDGRLATNLAVLAQRLTGGRA